MKSLTDQFISDLYGSLLHVDADSLSSANVPDVYDGLGNKSALSVGLENQGAVITGSLSAGNIVFPQQPSIIALIDYIYPVGSCLLTLNPTNPSVRFVGTNWEQVSQGLVITGVGTGTDKNSVSKTTTVGFNSGGQYQQTLTVDDIPDHYHFIANTISDHGVDNNDLSESNYLAQGGRLFTSFFAYELEGNATPAIVGKTSTIVTKVSSTPITLTNPSYGVYVWNRIS
jgi:hypothetical protein